ncbi:hypothetical protein D3C71_2093840 [compost metagenome]
MEQCHGDSLIGIHLLVELSIANRAEHMRQQGDMIRMLSDILGHDIAHQTPSFNIAKPIHIG